jgi:hypothetical protein
VQLVAGKITHPVKWIWNKPNVLLASVAPEPVAALQMMCCLLNVKNNGVPTFAPVQFPLTVGKIWGNGNAADAEDAKALAKASTATIMAPISLNRFITNTPLLDRSTGPPQLGRRGANERRLGMQSSWDAKDWLPRTRGLVCCAEDLGSTDVSLIEPPRELQSRVIGEVRLSCSQPSRSRRSSPLPPSSSAKAHRIFVHARAGANAIHPLPHLDQ